MCLKYCRVCEIKISIAMATNCKKKKAGVPGAEFIENDGTHCLEDIDCTSKNKFLWRWLAVKDDNNDYFSKYVRKLKMKKAIFMCIITTL